MTNAPLLQKLPENTAGIDWVVGDIHGCTSDLFRALDRAGFDYDLDRLLSVGDLIDRGPESFEALHLLYRGKGQRQWFFPVMGNHEQMMVGALCNGDAAMLRNWLGNGGSWALDEDFQELTMIAKDKVASLPLALEVPCGSVRVGVVHANVTSGQWGDFHPSRDAWCRERFRAGTRPAPIQGIDLVVAGHTICSEVTMLDNVAYIDTGAFTSKGHLTLCSLPDLIRLAT